MAQDALSERIARSDALLSELAALWGAESDAIVHLFGVPLAGVAQLGLMATTHDMVTVEVGPSPDGPYRTVNLAVRL